MTKKETKILFRKIKSVVALPQAMASYSADDWQSLSQTWCGIFSQTPIEHMIAAFHRYVMDGGRYWPYPGEIAERLPHDPCVSLRDVMDGRYTTKRDARELEARFERYGGRRI